MSQRPHILFITTDELRKQTLSGYGGQTIRTPNIDAIGAQGIQFDNAYTASPWCLPSRCAMLTGQFPHNSGAYSNFRKCELSADVPNMFQAFNGHGYQTALFGKCHFTPVPYSETRADVTLPYETFRDYYLSLGMKHLDLQDDKQVSVWFYDDYAKELDAAGYLDPYRRDTWDVQGKRKVFEFPGPAEWHPDSWVGRKALNYIENYDADGEEPLFAWVSFSGPHYPFDAPKEYYERVDMTKDEPRRIRDDEYDDPKRIHYRSFHGPGNIDGAGPAPGKACKNYTDEYWHELRRNYYANMAQIDDYVGLIVEAAERKFGDNVMIIFTADHGEMLGNHSIWGKNDCMYEDVWNVPLLVRYPRSSTAGAMQGVVTEAKVMLTDIMATCLAAAGLPEVPTDGRDFLQSMQDGGHPYVFAEGEGFIAVSDGTLKYVQTLKGGAEYAEMFDLEKDPHEYENVIERSEYAPDLARLRKAIINHFMPKLLA
ncbi:sulfatase family protein [Paenibacillus cremeus]|uniref:Sulfatase-like hydrolase/transferase n=1 Tax=Paenibacillus cremeus TaxID=2163881 RepID=A0A559KG46_9BACL|nr:sulfatase-like hydrolase/transferase [Paenibacillus cremeus]TVY11095.1 sulfatase-like hydrolase/transferase [Paenibacillus cremeus]